MAQFHKPRDPVPPVSEQSRSGKPAPARNPLKQPRILLLAALFLLFTAAFTYDTLTAGDASILSSLRNTIDSIDESGIENPQEGGTESSDASDSDGIRLQSADVFSFLIIGPYDESGAGTIPADQYAILSINHRSNKVVLNSLSPAFCSAMLGSEGEARGVCTEADAAALISGMESALAMPLDGYLLISAEAAVRILDKTGGITLALSAEEAASMESRLAGLGDEGSIALDQTGCARLSGTQAVAYLQIEEGVDIACGAGSRMEAVLLAMKTAASELGLIDLSSVGNTILKETTSNITERQFAQLFIRSPGLLKFRVETGAIPVEGSYALDGSGALTVTDPGAIQRYLYNTVFK